MFVAAFSPKHLKKKGFSLICVEIWLIAVAHQGIFTTYLVAEPSTSRSLESLQVLCSSISFQAPCHQVPSPKCKAKACASARTNAMFFALKALGPLLSAIV